MLKTTPDVIGDAHAAPFRDEVFDMVICDPPYSNELSKRIYGTGRIVYRDCSREAVRICKTGGYVVVYQQKWLPRPKGTVSHRRIFLAVRIWQNLRCVSIYRKDNSWDSAKLRERRIKA